MKTALRLGTIDISVAQGGKGLLGDLDGDGRMEICVGGSVTCLYDAEGNELW